MRTLDQIFDRQSLRDRIREILLEDGEWCLYRRLDYMSAMPLIIHRCQSATCAIDTDYKYVCGSGKPEDGGCGAPVPERLKGFLSLCTCER